MITAASMLLCGCASSGRPTVTADRTQAIEAALRLWSGFPAGSSPRPLVLAGPEIIDPTSGFRNGDDKEAYVYGNFTVATTLPGDSPTWHQQRLLTATQALADLSRRDLSTPPSKATLAITAARLGTATFATDRGQRTLPAWQFSFTGVRDVASVLAIAPSDRWPKVSPPPTDTGNLAASIAPGGDSVTLTFTGGPADPGPCQTNYQANPFQSGSAVLITITELPGDTTQSTYSADHPLACNGMGYRRSVTIKLDPVLAGRVLIDSYGAPLPAD
ncbi:MAG TPA: hypothetical protein VJ851_15405 [Jatrophihabitans sp.]|nr:hypothetical protein [Jatrophihabitans sp.]